MARTTSWNRKQPRPGPRSGSRSSPRYWTGPVARGRRGGVGIRLRVWDGTGRRLGLGFLPVAGHVTERYGTRPQAVRGSVARPSTTSTPGSASRIAGARDHLPRPRPAAEDDPLAGHHPRVDPDRQVPAAARTRSRRRSACRSGLAVASAGANDALRVPSRSRTARLTSSRYGASVTQAANRGGSVLPMTTIVLAESSGSKP